MILVQRCNGQSLATHEDLKEPQRYDQLADNAMKSSKSLGARAYLKSLQFALDKKPHQIDRLLLKSLPPVDQRRLEAIWTSRNRGLSNGLDMYLVPQTVKQAALLLSHDWPRATATLEWFNTVVSLLSPRSAVEMGCGAGFLLSFLRSKHPDLRIQGIDAAENLVRIAESLCGENLIAANYLVKEPDGSYDAVLCDFGFDMANFKPSRTPHSVSACGGIEYCPGCSDDLKLQLDEYFSAWRNWGGPEAHFAMAGRIPGFGPLKAFVLAAKDAGWALSLDQCRILTVRNTVGEVERVPALLFKAGSPTGVTADLEAIAAFYSGV